MQTLNVGAGRTDEEYKAAEEQRRADLLADSRGDANYFVVAAILAGLGTGLLPVRLNIFVSIGAIDLFALYGGQLVRLHPVVLHVAAVAWVVALLALGTDCRTGLKDRGSIEVHSLAVLSKPLTGKRGSKKGRFLDPDERGRFPSSSAGA
jgi:hypothetical protein